RGYPRGGTRSVRADRSPAHRRGTGVRGRGHRHRRCRDERRAGDLRVPSHRPRGRLPGIGSGALIPYRPGWRPGAIRAVEETMYARAVLLALGLAAGMLPGNAAATPVEAVAPSRPTLAVTGPVASGAGEVLAQQAAGDYEWWVQHNSCAVALGRSWFTSP